MNNPSVTVGRIGRPYGVKGYFKIHSFTEPPENFVNYASWYITIQNKSLSLINCKLQGNFIIGQIENCHSPEEAKKYVNQNIMISKNQLPELSNNQYYWADMINLDVYNLQKNYLGKVQEILETGANDVLVIINNNKKILIPYVLKKYIIEINLDTKQILVDWQEDWL